jgi:hypothetical protein
MHSANQHFVALARPAAMRATFVPYSQHFVALLTTAAVIATKRWLPSLPTQPQLTFARPPSNAPDYDGPDALDGAAAARR